LLYNLFRNLSFNVVGFSIIPNGLSWIKLYRVKSLGLSGFFSGLVLFVKDSKNFVKKNISM